MKNNEWDDLGFKLFNVIMWAALFLIILAVFGVIK